MRRQSSPDECSITEHYMRHYVSQIKYIVKYSKNDDLDGATDSKLLKVRINALATFLKAFSLGLAKK